MCMQEEMSGKEARIRAMSDAIEIGKLYASSQAKFPDLMIEDVIQRVYDKLVSLQKQVDA
jgi:hypothetical protein